MDWSLAVKTASSSITIEKLCALFATHGISKIIISDIQQNTIHQCPNGTVFLVNGVRHVIVTPYHPPSTGLAEYTIQTWKATLKKMSTSTLENKINNFCSIIKWHHKE